MEKELAEKVPEVVAPTDQLGNTIERHDGPGIEDMYKRGEAYGVPERGVDQYLFNRDSDENAPPTDPKNDPSLASAGWTGTGPPDGGKELADYLAHRENAKDWSGTGSPDGGAQLQEFLKHREDAEVGDVSKPSFTGTLKNLFGGKEDEADKVKAEREAAEKAAREKAAADKAAKEQAEKEAKEKTEREKAEREAREKAEKEAKEKADKEAKDKADKEAKDKAEQEAKNKGKGGKSGMSDPDQVTGPNTLPRALQEPARLLHDPTGAGVSQPVANDDPQGPPDPNAPIRTKPGNTGEPHMDPDYAEIVTSPDAPNKLNTAPVQTVNPLDQQAGTLTGTNSDPGNADPEHEHHAD